MARCNSKNLLLDTSKIQVSGDITADFNNREFFLSLTPSSKEAEVFSLQTPVEVEGSFETFNFRIPLSAIVITSIQFSTSPVISPLRWLLETPIPKDGSQYCRNIMKGTPS